MAALPAAMLMLRDAVRVRLCERSIRARARAPNGALVSMEVGDPGGGVENAEPRRMITTIPKLAATKNRPRGFAEGNMCCFLVSRSLPMASGSMDEGSVNGSVNIVVDAAPPRRSKKGRLRGGARTPSRP